MLLAPDYGTLQGLYNFEEYPDHEAIFRAGIISDKKLNPGFEAHLQSGSFSELHNEDDDISFRNTAIREFNGRVKAILAELKDTARTPAGCDHSECMISIAGALATLHQSKAKQRVLLLYTDLAENSTVRLCAPHGKYCWTLKDTVTLAKRLEELASLPATLTGIEVYLLYRPKSREDDQQYYVLSHVYRNLLEARGARVTISASNDINPH